MNELEPPKPPRVWPSFVTLVLALVGILVSGGVLGVVVIVQQGAKGLSPAELMARPDFLIWAAAVSQVCLSALTLLQVKSGLLLSMSGAAKATSPAEFAWLLVFGAIAPGLAEELTFRGLLQTRLVERWGVAIGVGGSATLFGLWHLDVRQGLMAMTMGLWLGWCALKHQGVVNVALAHVLNNGFAFTMTRFGDQQEEIDRPLATIAVTLVVVALCGLVVERRSRAQR